MLGMLSAAVGICAEALADVSNQFAAFNPSFFSNGEGGTSVDLSRFENGNPVDPGNYRLDVYVNGNWIGRQDVRGVSGEGKNAAPGYCFKRGQLRAMGIDFTKLPKGSQSSGHEPECLDLQQTVPGSTLDVDMSEQRATISVPQAYAGRRARGYVDPGEWDRGVTAGFLSYNANVFQTDSRDGADSTQYYAGVNAGLNLKDWRVRYNGSYNRSQTQGAPSSSRFDSLNAYAQRDVTALKSQLTLGEYYSPSDLFDSVPYTGVQLGSDDRMRPDSQNGFAPTIRGVADTNARVTVKQGDNTLYETTVAPGPFVIDDLYNTGYAGDLTIVVTESDGRVKSFVVPYASVSQLVRPGVTRYNVTAGQYRDDNLHDAPSFVQGTYQHGVSNLMTAYAGGIVAEKYLSGMGGLAFSTPLGALAADVTYSQASGLPDGIDTSSSMSGQSYRLTYSKLLDATSTNFTVAAYRFSSADFLNLQDYAWLRDSDDPNRQVYRQRNRFQLSVTQPLGEYGSFYFTGSRQDYWNRSQGNTTFQAGYNTGFSWGSLGLSASRTRNEDGNFDSTYMVTVNLPIGATSSSPMYLSTTTSYSDSRNNSLQTNLGGSLGEQHQLSYNLFASALKSDGDRSGSEGLSATYNAPMAAFSASASNGDDYRQASFGARGSLVAHPGGVNFTQNQGETMAIVEAKGAGGAKVLNNVGAKVSDNGYAVVSGLMPYRQNEVEIDPKGISPDVELEVTSQSVAPRFGSIVMLKYPTVAGKPVLLQVTRDDGIAIPLGAEVLDADGKPLSMVGQGGQIFLRGIAEQGRLLIRWGEGEGQSCRLGYSLPSESAKGAVVQKVAVRCQVVTRGGALALSGT
ncbi:fimbria/pilus outer membrane usher protein [Pseudomonas sp. MT3]